MTRLHHIVLAALLLACPSLATAQLLNLSGKGVGFELTPKPEPPSTTQEKYDETPDVPKVAEPHDSSTAICQCRGSNRQVCYCLKANVKCGCNRTKGSEWTTSPFKKTGRYFDPNDVAQSILRKVIDAPTPQKANAEPVSYPVAIDAYDRQSWVANGQSWSLDPGYRLAEGQRDGTGRWMFKNGRIIDTSAEAVEHVDRSTIPNGPPSLPSSRRAIYFGAVWCPGCVWMYQNTLPGLQEQGWRFGQGDNLHVQIVDADNDQSGLMEKYGVTRLPTTLILEGNRVIDRKVGAINTDQFREVFYQ